MTPICSDLEKHFQRQFGSDSRLQGLYTLSPKALERQLKASRNVLETDSEFPMLQNKEPSLWKKQCMKHLHEANERAEPEVFEHMYFKIADASFGSVTVSSGSSGFTGSVGSSSSSCDSF